MKKFFVTFFLILLTFFLTNCSSKNENLIKPKKTIPLELLYKEAYKNFEQGKYQDAVELFQEVEKNYGYTEWAAKALLLKSYIYYDSSRYVEALENLKNFKKLYSGNSELAYVEYLIAICLFEQINISARDQTNTKLSFQQFNKVIKNYPNTPYAEDLKLKLDLINDQLAGKEMYVARYYQKREKWLAAFKRLTNILENYQTTIYIEEALHRMVEIHYKIGNIEAAKKYASILGYNFNDSDWFKKSYTIVVDKDFVVKQAKTKKTLREKLKALIN
jgi:outer membrane protein assembly factor BamD